MKWVKTIGRILGWLLLALALLAAGAEALASLQSGAWKPIAFGQVWYDIHKESLAVAQPAVQRYLHPAIWDALIVSILLWPAWSVPLIPAVVLLLLCRKKWKNRSFA